MRFVTSIEKLAKKEGKTQGLKKARQILVKGLKRSLESKFGPAGVAFVRELQSVSDLSTLTSLLQAVGSAGSLDELRAILN